MELASSSSSDDQICKLCNEKQRRYVCPKCNIAYCSIECYKSTAHLECSEEFFKKCVEEELHLQQNDPSTKHRTLDMLQRIYNEDIEDDVLKDILQEADDEVCSDEGDLDSDDENVPTLEKRLENINLDNAEELWSALTVSEKQEFEALIKNGDASKLLPSWNPWWSYTVEKKLVQDVTEKDQFETYQKNCPKILDIPALESFLKASPFIKFSIVNTIYAYAYSVMFFNGEHHSTPIDSIYIFLRICETLRVNRIFKDVSSAIENVLLEITNCEALSGDQETILGTKEAGDLIMNGPKDDNKSFYVLAALSDLHVLLAEAKKEITEQKKKSTKCEFKSKFQSEIKLGTTEVSKKNLSLFMKKIEFYIAWLKTQTPTFSITEECT